jgi:hypothetical protein
MPLRSNFIGTGNMEEFCNETNKLFSAINNIQFQMPTGYAGVEPTVQVFDDRIVFDFGNALIFTLNNVVWNLTGSATFNSNTVGVSNGVLVINVDAD